MNAIEQVLSIPEIKSEHPRLYSQALGELETMKGQAARIAELEARVKELEAGLKEIQSSAEEAQGEWHLVSILYTPEKIAPYKEIENIAARILLETK